MYVLSGLIGALIGAGITLFFNMWKLHRDERSSRCDELCEAINDAADLAASYWFQIYKSDNDQLLEEARLFASQIHIDGSFEQFGLFLTAKSETKIAQELSDFYDALTGGDYSVPKRNVDMVRGRQAYALAGLLSLSIRKAYRETLPLFSLAQTYHHNKRRVLDMPTKF